MNSQDMMDAMRYAIEEQRMREEAEQAFDRLREQQMLDLRRMELEIQQRALEEAMQYTTTSDTHMGLPTFTAEELESIKRELRSAQIRRRAENEKHFEDDLFEV